MADQSVRSQHGEGSARCARAVPSSFSWAPLRTCLGYPDDPCRKLSGWCCPPASSVRKRALPFLKAYLTCTVQADDMIMLRGLIATPYGFHPSKLARRNASPVRVRSGAAGHKQFMRPCQLDQYTKRTAIYRRWQCLMMCPVIALPDSNSNWLQACSRKNPACIISTKGKLRHP
jgi:hypothetical protein